jgi:hypothetical protein
VTTAAEDLTLRARFLRNAAPQAFEDFHRAFAIYTNRKFYDLVDTTGNLAQAQGHAQQCKAILQLLEGVKNG